MPNASLEKIIINFSKEAGRHSARSLNGSIVDVSPKLAPAKESGFLRRLAQQLLARNANRRYASRKELGRNFRYGRPQSVTLLRPKRVEGKLLFAIGSSGNALRTFTHRILAGLFEVADISVYVADRNTWAIVRRKSEGASF